jgi:hypothetical protein
MPEESRVSWKSWVVISIVTAGLTPVAIEFLPSIASTVSQRWKPAVRCIASLSQPDLPLKIYQAPDAGSRSSFWQQGEPNAQVVVVGERQGWYRVSAPDKGWVKGDSLSFKQPVKDQGLSGSELSGSEESACPKGF